jgi:hypothetical protein
MEIKIAINPNHKNKMPTGLGALELRKWWRTFNGGFSNFTIPVQKFKEAIGRGHAYTAQHKGYRKAEEFLCGQHVGLDFDTGDHLSSIEGLFQDDFIQENAALIHTTASHKESAPKARVIFILERPIYSVKKYALVTEAFAETYKTNGSADPSCKDAVRLFFGAEGCEILDLGNVLTMRDAAYIVNPYKEKLAKSRVTAKPVVTGTPDEFTGVANSLVNRVLSAPDGAKWDTLVKISRTFGGYIASGYIDETSAFNELYNAISSRGSVDNLKTAEDAINWGLRVGQQAPLDLEKIDDPIARGLFGI